MLHLSLPPSLKPAIRAASLALLMALFAADAHAQALRVVALGASNTEGKGRGATNMGVARAQAYPAQLERMLRARGYDARVTNAGVAGDTTAGMLARVARAVPNGTHVVILQPGGNDTRRGGSEGGRAANIAEITQRLRARNVTVIMLERFGAGIGQHRLADGQHFGAEGHAAVAAQLLPQVIAAAGGRAR
jgi:acyl-CoA thioesterase-1